MNDDPELAVAVDADAVHVGPQDARVAEVRAAFGSELVIGGSAGDAPTARTWKPNTERDMTIQTRNATTMAIGVPICTMVPGMM